jgi:hypothetical protein
MVTQSTDNVLVQGTDLSVIRTGRGLQRRTATDETAGRPRTLDIARTGPDNGARGIFAQDGLTRRRRVRDAKSAQAAPADFTIDQYPGAHRQQGRPRSPFRGPLFDAFEPGMRAVASAPDDPITATVVPVSRQGRTRPSDGSRAPVAAQICAQNVINGDLEPVRGPAVPCAVRRASQTFIASEASQPEPGRSWGRSR